MNSLDEPQTAVSPGRAKTIAADVRANAPMLVRIGILALACSAFGASTPALLDWMRVAVPSIGHVFDALSIDTAPAFSYLPLGMLAVTIACMLIEAAAVGYERSGLSRLLRGGSASMRTDMFYFFLRLSGATFALSVVLSGGGYFLAAGALSDMFGLSLLSNVDNLVVHFVAAALAADLTFWLFHRTLHTPVLWEVHKVHHAAEDYNVLLPYRNHPLDHLIASLLAVVSAAFLGIKPEALMAWLIVNAFYQSLVHSHMTWPDWMNAVLITPQAHRIHHSIAPHHAGRNLSIFGIWDRVFGTYLRPGDPVPGFGLDDPEEPFNRDRPWTELWLVLARWLRLA